MKIFYYLIVLLLCICFQACCSNIEPKLSIKIKNIPSKKIYIAKYHHDKSIIIDTIFSNDNNNFVYPIGSKILTGIYKIIFANKSFDVILTNSNVEIVTCFNSHIDSMTIKNSSINIKYMKYRKIKKEYDTKLNLLLPLHKSFPVNDNFYNEITKKIISICFKYENEIKNIIQKNKNTFLSAIIKTDCYPLFDINITNRLPYLKKHFLDSIVFSEPDIINTPILSNKTFMYINLYSNKLLQREKQEQLYIEAIDKILVRASESEQTLTFLLDYLTNGFEKLQLDNVVNYITENYILDNTCIDENRKKALKNRVDFTNIIRIGKIAPEIITTMANGDKFTLSKNTYEYTLIVFWASWCNHCKELLSNLNTVLKQSKLMKNLSVVAISLDTSITNYGEYLSNKNFTWTNCIEQKGWDSKVAKDYYLFATPTIILLDKKKKIVAKPFSVKGVEKILIGLISKQKR